MRISHARSQFSQLFHLRHVFSEQSTGNDYRGARGRLTVANNAEQNVGITRRLSRMIGEFTDRTGSRTDQNIPAREVFYAFRALRHCDAQFSQYKRFFEIFDCAIKKKV